MGEHGESKGERKWNVARIKKQVAWEMKEIVSAANTQIAKPNISHCDSPLLTPPVQRYIPMFHALFFDDSDEAVDKSKCDMLRNDGPDVSEIQYAL